MDTKAFQNRLMGWFRKNARDLPWRHKRTPYATWISEMMLQQTQVKTMLPYFDAWMKAFPSVAALDQAPLEKVLLKWQGLGYYARARNLKKCARVLMEMHGGRIPADYEKLQELPGIGPYSAGAIASIGFNLKAPIVDGNVLRVLARVYAIEEPVDRPATRQRILELQSSLVPRRDPGVFNEALMELGALVCTPQNPSCPLCPVAALCAALKAGKTDELPRKQNKSRIVKIQAWAVVLRKNEKVFVHRRPEGQIMGGLWEFPEEKWRPGRTVPNRREIETIALRAGVAKESVKKIFTVKRNYTRFAETLNVYSADAVSISSRLSRNWESRWIDVTKLAELPLTSAHAKIRSRL